MTTLRFSNTARLPGRAQLVEVIVNGQALVVTTLAKAMEYTSAQS